MTLDDLFQQAVASHTAGNFPEAERFYRQVLVSVPNHPGALHHLGLLAHQVGQNDVALKLIQRSIAMLPTSAAYSNLGEVYRLSGHFEEAVAAYRQAIALEPTAAPPWSNLGLALRQLRQFEQSESACRRALELDPNYAGAYQNLCNVLGDRGKPDEAIAAGQRAAELDGGNATVWADLGAAYIEANDLAPAALAFERAIQIDPNNAAGHHNLAQALLLQGEFERGWREYEWRWRCPEFPSPPRNFPQKQWDGSPLDGRTLLIHAEQGLGDTMMFARYLPIVAQRGGRVLFEVQKELRELLKNFPGTDQVIARGQVIPAVDLQCPLLSLPIAMGTQVQTIPVDVPYIQADPKRVAQWDQRLAPQRNGLRVGIVWAGRPTHTNDHNRSCRLVDFAPLAAIEGITFYSLQIGPAASQAANPPAGMQLIDLGAELQDYSDTAAVVSQLDLVISVDTSVVHLTGAMGRPVWVLLPLNCDWRWIKGRDDSPWYPMMRLFRQTAPNSWPEVFERVAGELRGLVSRLT